MSGSHNRPVSGEPDAGGRRFTATEAKLLAIGVLALLAGIFIGQNVGKVTVHFVFFTAKIRLIWLFLLCVLVGVGLDRFAVVRSSRARDRREKRPTGRGLPPTQPPPGPGPPSPEHEKP